MSDLLNTIYGFGDKPMTPKEVEQTAFVKSKYFDTRVGFLGRDDMFDKIHILHPDIPRPIVNRFYRDNIGIQQTHTQMTRNDFAPIYAPEWTEPSFQLDLAFLHKYESKNKGYKVLLTCININSRYAYAYKSKNKTAASIMYMMNEFIRDATHESKKPPKTFSTDRGSEFISQSFKALCEKHHITHWLADINDHHIQGMIERFNRTLKAKLDLTYGPLGPIWYDKIVDIVYNYNHTVHSSTGVAPADFTEEDDQSQIEYNRARTALIRKSYVFLRLGDPVRIRDKKTLFDRGVPSYSKEVYLIDKVNPEKTYELRHVNSDVRVNNIIQYNQKGHVIEDSQGQVKTFKHEELKKIPRSSTITQDSFPGFVPITMKDLDIKKQTIKEHKQKLKLVREKIYKVEEPIHQKIEVSENRRSTRLGRKEGHYSA